MELCIRCKGRNFCKKGYCQIYSKIKSLFKYQPIFKKDFQSSTNIPFVGRYGYPYVNLGIISPLEISDENWIFDSPHYWSKQNLQIPELINLRSQLVNARTNTNIKSQQRIMDISQEVSQSIKPVDLEINLKKIPKFNLNVNNQMAPTGPNIDFDKILVTNNPRIPTKVDKVVSDYDLKANEAVMYLYKHEFDENFLSKVLSTGSLGLKKNRKLVPTRFSITAIDDTIGKNLIDQIKEYPTSNYYVYFGGYLGNYFLIMFFPEIWSYELFEIYKPKAEWNRSDKIQYTTDYENYYGRKTYAQNCAGGYYAARLPILEKLDQSKRQASVLTIRVTTEEYYLPMGVFVVREAVRKAMNNRVIEFSDKESMLKYARDFIRKKFNFEIESILNDSVLLKNIKQQSKLTNFL